MSKVVGCCFLYLINIADIMSEKTDIWSKTPPRQFSVFINDLAETLKLVSAIFYKIFIFHQMIALQKLWKMFFISSKKLFSFSRYSNFCILSLPLQTFQIQKDKWKWNNSCYELACTNFADVIFEITQKLLYITSSNLVR